MDLFLRSGLVSSCVWSYFIVFIYLHLHKCFVQNCDNFRILENIVSYFSGS